MCTMLLLDREARHAVVRGSSSRNAVVRGSSSDQACRCKNLALNIRDFVSLVGSVSGLAKKVAGHQGLQLFFVGPDEKL